MHGVIVFHVSNRHMALQGPVAAVGSAEGLIAYGKNSRRPDDSGDEFRTSSEVVVLARDERDLGDLPSQPGWKRLGPGHAPGLDR
jgi:hypothetical protein